MKFLLKLILVLCLFPYIATAQVTGNKNTKNTKSTKPAKDTAVVEEIREVIKEDRATEVYEEAPAVVEEVMEVAVADYGSGSGNKKYEINRINDVASLIYRYNSSTGDNEYGVMKNGRQVLPMIFKSGYSSSEYNAMIRILGIGKKYGVFDIETEKWIIPIQYDEMTAFNSSTFIVRKGAFYGILDISNKMLVPMEWNRLQKVSGVDNYAIVGKNTSYGILSVIDNKLTTPCVYSEIQPIENSTGFKVRKDNTYNIVDINNKPRFKNWYQEMFLSSNKRKNYIVKLGDRMGIIDESEKIVLPIEYQEIKSYPYNDGSYLARNKNGKYGCVTLDGRISLPFEYDNLAKGTYENSILAMKGDKCGLIQINEGLPYEIVACDFDTISYSRTVFIVEKNHKFGLMDLFGKIISPIEFDKIEMNMDEYDSYSSSSKVFIATKNKMQFLINDKGEAFNEAKYKQILPLYSSAKNDYYSSSYKRSNYFVYYKDGKAGVLDLFGKEITANIFDDILYVNQANNLVVKKGDKVGYYSLFGKNMVLEPKYDHIFDSSGKIYAQIGNSFYLLTVDNNGKVTESKL